MTTVRFIVLITLLIIPGPAPGEETGLTPLHRAAGKGDGDAVQVLVKAGADVDAKTTTDAVETGEKVWTP